MKNHLLLASVLLTTILTGCNTVKGTFDGMGKDLNSVAPSGHMQANTNDSNRHSSYQHKSSHYKDMNYRTNKSTNDTDTTNHVVD